LRETIQSVLDQGYPSLEYIIIDGGSTDGSVEIIREYSDRLKYWTSEPDRGHGHALNKGLAMTTGEIMAWLNSDDKYLPWTFEVVAEIFSTFPEVNWIVGTNAWWDDRGRLSRAEVVYKNIFDYLWGGNRYKWIQQESVFWRRSLWEKAGSRINEDYKLMVDGELWCRFFLADRLFTVESILGGYRRHDSNRAQARMGEVVEEMEKAIAWLRSNCDPAHLNTFKVLQKILALRSNPQSHLTPLAADVRFEFSRACEEAAYDRIAYNNGRWEKSKVACDVCR
jgi:glycosyltransferase involved in cell wall biosynthesis